MGYKDTVISGETRNLSNGDFEILELFFYSALLTFADQGIATEGYE